MNTFILSVLVLLSTCLLFAQGEIDCFSPDCMTAVDSLCSTTTSCTSSGTDWETVYFDANCNGTYYFDCKVTGCATGYNCENCVACAELYGTGSTPLLTCEAGDWRDVPAVKESVIRPGTNLLS